MFSPAIVNKVNRDFYELSGWQELDVGLYPAAADTMSRDSGLGSQLWTWERVESGVECTVPVMCVDIPGIGADYLSPIKSQLSPAQSNADPGPGKGWELRWDNNHKKILHRLKISTKLSILWILWIFKDIDTMFYVVRQELIKEYKAGEQNYSVDI